jgi:hypothetical protein
MGLTGRDQVGMQISRGRLARLPTRGPNGDGARRRHRRDLRTRCSQTRFPPEPGNSRTSTRNARTTSRLSQSANLDGHLARFLAVESVAPAIPCGCHSCPCWRAVTWICENGVRMERTCNREAVLGKLAPAPCTQVSCYPRRWGPITPSNHFPNICRAEARLTGAYRGPYSSDPSPRAVPVPPRALRGFSRRGSRWR